MQNLKISCITGIEKSFSVRDNEDVYNYYIEKNSRLENCRWKLKCGFWKCSEFLISLYCSNQVCPQHRSLITYMICLCHALTICKEKPSLFKKSKWTPIYQLKSQFKDEVEVVAEVIKHPFFQIGLIVQ